MALGAEPGHATLHFDPGMTVLSSLHQRDLAAFGMALGSTVDVEVARLDDYCDTLGIATVDLLKIDVEGHERDVLAGAERRLGDGAIGIVQFEYGGTYLDAGVRLRDVLDRFPETYAIHRIVPWGLMPVTDRDLRDESFALSNFVAVGPAHARRVGLTRRGCGWPYLRRLPTPQDASLHHRTSGRSGRVPVVSKTLSKPKTSGTLSLPPPVVREPPYVLPPDRSSPPERRRLEATTNDGPA